MPCVTSVPPSANGNVTWRYEEVGALLQPSFGADNPHLSGGSRLLRILKSHQNQKQPAATEGYEL